MFEIDESLVRTTQDKLLYNIMELLMKEDIVEEKVIEKKMTRPELMKAIAKLPDKPKGWNHWKVEQMQEFYDSEVK